MINISIVSIIISVIILYLFDANINLFWFILSISELLALITWWSKYNYKLIEKMFICTVITSCVSWVNLNNFKVLDIRIFLFIVILFSVQLFFLIKYKVDFIKSVEKRPLLIKSRKYDLERIEEYIEKYNIVGINSEFGNGKSFITEELLRKNKNKFEIIKINLLSYNFDEFNLILIKELNKILKKYKIFSKASYELQHILNLNHTIQGILLSVVETDLTFAEAVAELKKDAEKILNRKILVIFEDIDRIGDYLKIKKIFSISELLSSNHIKILYQFDQDELKKIGFTREYTEKYIPYTVNLTKLSYREIIRDLLKEEQFLSFTSKEKEELLLYGLDNLYYHDFNSLFHFNLRLQVNLSNLSIRKVYLYLHDCKYFLSKTEFSDNDVRKIVINILIIKHFLYEIYTQIKFGMCLEEELCFVNLEKENITMQEIIDKFQNLTNEDQKIEYSKKIVHMFDENDKNDLTFNNITNLSILAMLGFKFRFKQNISALEQLEIEEHNIKINRLLWYIKWNGRSELTDLEYGIKLFKKEVLSLPLSKQSEAFSILWERMYHSNLQKDNISMFYFGRTVYLPLFEGFYIYKQESNDIIKLIDFYELDRKTNNLDYEFVSLLIYCRFPKKSVLIRFLIFFNKSNAIYDLSNIKEYAILLKNVFRALSIFASSYFKRLYDFLLNFDISIKKNKELFVHELNHVEQRFSDLCTNNVLSIKSDIFIYKTFLNKNIQILSCSKVCSINNFQNFNVRVSESKIQKIKKQLSSVFGSDRKKLLDEFYNKGEINIDEYISLYAEFLDK